MTLFDLIMGCDNVVGTVAIKVFSNDTDIAPSKVFTLSDYLEDGEYYELTRHLEVKHFDVRPSELVVWIYELDM